MAQTDVVAVACQVELLVLVAFVAVSFEPWSCAVEGKAYCIEDGAFARAGCAADEKEWFA